MFKKSFFTCLFYLLAFTGCVNKDDPTAEKANATWIFDGQNYSTLQNNSSGSNVHFTLSATESAWALCNALPNGAISSYKIKKGPATSLADNEMVFKIDHGINESWYSTGEGNNYAVVTKGYYGEIKISIPPVAVRHFVGGTMQNDSTVASCEFNY